MEATGKSQWLFSVSAVLDCTPSRTSSSISVEKELYDRARGVEFLYRLGVTLGLYVYRATHQPRTMILTFEGQAIFSVVHCRYVVPSLLHALLHGGLPPTGMHPSTS